MHRPPQPIPPGTPAPSLDSVSGWVNLPPGESVELSGKIAVVDCWASWCGPCRAEAPKLAAVVQQYRPLGVEFIAITAETALDLPEIQRAIDGTPGMDWPVAYGGYDFIAELDVPGYPTLIVIGPGGDVRWSYAGVGGAEGVRDALDAALATR